MNILFIFQQEDVSGWLAPGEGYTPEPMEFHHLNEIDIKLQVLLSDGDFSAISSSCSKLPSQIYQVYYTTELMLQISCLKCVLRSDINENTACVCTWGFF